MKLSDAIRLGSMLHPQCFGILHRYTDPTMTVVVASCALGAADAAGYGDIWESQNTEAFFDCPLCVPQYRTWLANVITHLNDDHRWTREAIADWVETIELAAEAPPELAPRPAVIETAHTGSRP